MFFQINVTPKEKKVKKRTGETEQAEPEPPEMFELVLAPFQPQARIKLESRDYSPVKCSLTIKNPSNKNLNITVVKMPPPERLLELAASELSIEAGGASDLGITWTPREIGSWRDTLQLQDSRRIKYDVAITTTSSGIKKAKGQRGRRVLGPSNANASNASVRAQRLSPPSTIRSTKNPNETAATLLNGPSKKPRLNVEQENKENSTKVYRNYQMHQEKRKNYSASPGRHDFSAIINSTTFNLTPVKSNVGKDRQQEDVEFSPHQYGLPSLELPKVPDSRRETYTAATYCKSSVAFLNVDKEEDDNFVDSLSPQPEEYCEKKPSDFSLLINNIDLLTPNTPVQLGSTEKFSPTGCSTGFRGRTLIENSTPKQPSPVPLATGNSTFDVSATDNGNNSRANGTYELTTSPSRIDSLAPIRPTRLSKSFEKISPVRPSTSNECGQNSVPSSSPIRFEMISMHHEYSTRTSISHVSQLNNDDASVKEVLEADLWAKSESQQSFACSRVRCTTLETISEEKNRANYNIGRSFTVNKTTVNESTKTRKLEISPPKKYSGNKTAPIRKISPTKGTKIRKERNASEPAASLKKKIQMNYTGPIKRGQVKIPGVRMAHLSLAGLNKGNKSVQNSRTDANEAVVKLHDPNDFLMRFCNPDAFGATMTQDPFLTSTLYYDDKWMYHQEKEFKKWLNALLTPEENLSTDVDEIRVDVAKVWQSCRAQENVTLAETREAVSARYHTNTRLNTLRKAACAMFRREEVTTPLSKATVCIERGTLMIRQDRDLHRDIGLQKGILELFLCYNPLWLRIGLETVYGETIPLHSNNDLVGLTRFLITRFFSDPFIVKQHSHSTISSLKLPSFTVHMNKFILKKFVLLVFFLDYAKRNKLIGHDPCLFHKQAPHKDSRSILLTFSRELLSGVGDVTKVLRTHDYTVSHKQTHLDEYDYAVKDLAVDLRDGVRLCRVMELITGDRNLTCRCRVPAISRLQKVHNVDVALAALLRCDYKLTGDIDAKSVADGHREKTLSLLWQLIYKYQAPRFEKAAKCIQKWWCSKLWYVRVRHFLRTRKDNAASTIQRAWRCYRARKIVDELRAERARLWAEKEEAIRVIQLHWIRRMKMLEERRKFLVAKEAIIKIQRWYRRKRETQPFVNNLRVKREAIVTIQRHWRAELLMRNERVDYLEKLRACTKIQCWWRARCAGREVHQRYQIMKKATILIQTKWRAHRLMRMAAEDYKIKLNAVRKIQFWWRRILKLRDEEKRNRAATILQKRWRETLIARKERSTFVEYRSIVIAVQTRYRARRIARITRNEYLKKRDAAIVLQKNWRMIKALKRYREQKNAAIVLQWRWRSRQQCIQIETNYLVLRKVTINLQRRYRANKIGVQTRTSYLQLRSAVLNVQKRWRANKLMKETKDQFTKNRNAAIILQSNWRMIVQRRKYITFRKAAINLQHRYRANKSCVQARTSYLQLRTAVLNTQKRWRANKLMKEAKDQFTRYRNAAIVLQSNWKMILQRRKYVTFRKATINVQRRYRANKSCVQARTSYMQLRSAVLNIQNQWRANKLMKEAKAQYAEYRKAAVRLQSNWKMILQRRKYRKIRNAALTIQMKWRATVASRQSSTIYLKLKAAALIVQRRYRANKACKIAREEYAKTRERITWIQRQWRKKLENRAREDASINIQIWWRSILTMRECKLNYEAQKAAALVIQTRYRAYKLGSEVRRDYIRVVQSILRIQRAWRTFARRKRDEKWRRDCKKAVLTIENWWIRMMEERRIREAELELLRKQSAAASIIQAAWRGHKIRSLQSASMRELRSRVKKAAETAVPSATVAYQLQESVHSLLSCKTIGQLSMCVVALDTLTRLTSESCIEFCRLGLVDKMYGTLAISNRSLPWLEVCERCISILINVAKLPETKHYVYRVEYIETLARLMSITVEKHVPLFLQLATLMWLLAENPEYAEAVRNCPRSSWLLRSLQTTVTKKKLNCSKQLCGNLNKSVGKKSVLQLPNTKRDWGLKGELPRLFTIVDHAVSSLIDRLKLDPAT